MHLSLFVVIAGAALCLARIPDTYQRIPGYSTYRYSAHKLAWEAAKAECEREGGTLAVMNSLEEARAVRDFFNAKRRPNDGLVALIGFQDKEEEGVYRTVQGGTLDSAGYNVWKYPPTGSRSNKRKDCGGMIICGRLTDVDCSEKLTFICEFPDPEPE